MIFAIRVFKKQAIEEISFGYDRLFVCYTKEVKIKIGLTFFLGAGVLPRYSEDETLKEHQIERNRYLVLIIYSILFVILLILSELNLNGLLNYLAYFLFIIKFSKLIRLLPKFSGITLLLGIYILALISWFVDWFIIGKLKLRNGLLTNLYLVIILTLIVVYVRLFTNYILS